MELNDGMVQVQENGWVRVYKKRTIECIENAAEQQCFIFVVWFYWFVYDG